MAIWAGIIQHDVKSLREFSRKITLIIKRLAKRCSLSLRQKPLLSEPILARAICEATPLAQRFHDARSWKNKIIFLLFARRIFGILQLLYIITRSLSMPTLRAKQRETCIKT